MSNLLFTIYTGITPRRLTKVLGIDAEGKLTKTAAATMVSGTAEHARVADLHELATRLETLQPNQAVGWGVSPHAKVEIVPQDRATGGATSMARSRENFEFPCGPGIWMLDHDGVPGRSLDADALRAELIEACPALTNAPMLWRPSVSAGVVAPDGRQLTGLTRHRLYIPVSDASAIPEAGRRLALLLWAAGKGWHEVGSAGQALQRCLVDASVWQPERLDFAAPPVLEDGLMRPAVGPRIFGDPAGLFDLAAIQSSAQASSTHQRIKESRMAIRAECKARREVWAAERAPALALSRRITVQKARDVLARASEHAVLMGDFQLTAADGEVVTVGQVLDNPSRWHNARFADPLDPDHDRRVAVVNLRSGGAPTLYSHRHGGVRFELMRQTQRVQVGRGLRVQTTDAVLQVLRDRGELFDYGEGTLVHAAAGRLRPVKADWLVDHMGRICAFYRAAPQVSEDGQLEPSEPPDDAPMAVARAILAKHSDRCFRPLAALITAPTMRLDGTVLDSPGYDPDTQLLYHCERPGPPIPPQPSPADALAALRRLWQPVSQFPLVDDIDRGVVLAALLTAAVRAILPTAPGFGFNAPAAGTGKTLLARCIGILSTGQEPPILPPADTDDETRKRLFAALRDGSRVLLWDNLREPLGCASLDAFLTSATFTDRVLGVSETAVLPNRALFIATGNNLRVVSDTCRRVLVASLDAKLDRPYARQFNVAPAQLFLRDRPQLVAAALTILRAYVCAGRPRHGNDGVATFEDWDEMVRQPVCWLKTLITDAGGADLPRLDDPLLATDRAFANDPETLRHAALIRAWSKALGSVQHTVAMAADRATSDSQMRHALEEIGSQSGKINNRTIGRWIERMAGRRIQGMWFEKGTLVGGVQSWKVRSESAAPQKQPTTSIKPTESASAAGPIHLPAAPLGGFDGTDGFVSRSGAFADPALGASAAPPGITRDGRINGHHHGA